MRTPDDMPTADTRPAASQEPAAEAQSPLSVFPGTLDRLDQLLGIIFIGVVSLNFASAASRYAAGRPIVGADEVQVYVMVWLVFLGAVMAAMRRAHLRMDVLIMNLRPLAAWWRTLGELLLVLATSSTMAWVSLQFTLQIHGMDQRSDAAEIPMWIPHISVAVGFTGLAMCALLELRQLFKRRPW